MTATWEAKITFYRNGRRVDFFDAHGDTPKDALWNASTDAERWVDDWREPSKKEAAK